VEKKSLKTEEMPIIKVMNNGSEVIIIGNDFKYIFNMLKGSFTSIEYKEVELISSAPALNIWRAPTDNDMHIKIKWKEQGFERLLPHIYAVNILSSDDTHISFCTELSLGGYIKKPVIHAKNIWTVYGSGDIIFETEAKVREDLMFLPRFGLQINMTAGNENIDFFGYGPQESYIDKRRSTRKSRFKTTVNNNHENYLKPQENGSHYKTEWAYVSDLKDQGLLFIGMDEFSFNVSHYTALDISNAKHPHELKRREEVIVNLDYGISGVGSNSCGPELLPQYRLSQKDINYKVRIKPVFEGGNEILDIVNSQIIK
jgi:beta-galactosidase